MTGTPLYPFDARTEGESMSDALPVARSQIGGRRKSPQVVWVLVRSVLDGPGRSSVLPPPHLRSNYLSTISNYRSCNKTVDDLMPTRLNEPEWRGYRVEELGFPLRNSRNCPEIAGTLILKAPKSGQAPLRDSPRKLSRLGVYGALSAFAVFAGKVLATRRPSQLERSIGLRACR